MLNINTSIIKNFLSLLSSQALSYIVPLITYPYIISTIGISKFGDISFILTIMTFINVFIDFGYNYNAPRSISLAKNDVILLSKTFSRIYLFKLIGYVASIIILIFAACVLNSINAILIIGGFVYLLNLILLPHWFFQGVEKMEFITIVDLISKISFTILIFFIVKNPDDYIYILPIWGLGGIISGIIGILIAIYRFNIILYAPSKKELINEIVKGYPIFIANIATHSFTNSNILVLGLLYSNFEVGIYSIAEKLAKIPWTLSGIFASVIFPRICIESQKGIEHLNKYQFNLMKIIMPVTIASILLIVSFSGYIISFFSEENIDTITGIFNILVFSTIFVTLNIPFNLTLISFNLNKLFMNVFIKVAIINVFLSFFLISFFKELGAAISHLSTVIFLLIGLIFALKNNRNLLNHEEH